MQPRTALPITIAVLLAGTLAAAGQSAVDFPARKPGYWEIGVVTEKPAGAPTLDTKVCIDAATDRELMEFGLRMSKDACTRFDMKKTGKGLVIDSDCKFAGVTSNTRTTMSGDFQTSYTTRIEGTTEGIPGAAKGKQDTLIVQTAKWGGATCPDGMKAGDFTLPGGIKMNIKKVQQWQKLLPNIQIR